MTALDVEHVKPEVPAPPRRRQVCREAENRLRESGYYALRDVSCDVHEGEIHLDGRLPSHYLKQVAQYLANEVAGLRRVVNRIEVIAPPDRPERAREGNGSS